MILLNSIKSFYYFYRTNLVLVLVLVTVLGLATSEPSKNHGTVLNTLTLLSDK